MKPFSICMSLIKSTSFLVILLTFLVLFKSPSTSSSPRDSSSVIPLYYQATHYLKLLHRSSQYLKMLLQRTLPVSKLHSHLQRSCRQHKYRYLIMKAATVSSGLRLVFLLQCLHCFSLFSLSSSFGGELSSFTTFFFLRRGVICLISFSNW